MRVKHTFHYRLRTRVRRISIRRIKSKRVFTKIIYVLLNLHIFRKCKTNSFQKLLSQYYVAFGCRANIIEYHIE